MELNQLITKSQQALRFAVTCIKKAWAWYKGLYHDSPWYKKTAVGGISFFLALFFYLFAVNVNLFWLFGKSPTIHDIMHPETNEASMLYSNDGVLLGKYFNENRTPVTFEEINPDFFTTLIDTEDERFYQHHGIDVQGLFAAAKDITRGHARGASTLTQQLVKNMFRVRTQYSTGLLGKIPGLSIIIKKSKEWILALEIELFYSKEEILTMYANTVDFGSNAFGIKTAAHTYFATTPDRLTLEQSAVLVALLKATSTYNPRLNPERSLERRNLVLRNLFLHRHKSKQEIDSIQKLPLALNFSVETAYDGDALHFRQVVANELRQWCRKNGYDLYTDGLKIFTTIDSRMQHYAEQAVNTHMRTVQNIFNNHWAGSNPWRDEQYREMPHFIESIAKHTSHYAALQKTYNNNQDSIDFYLNKPHRVHLFDYDGGHDAEMSTLDSIRYMVRFLHASFVAMEPETGWVKAWVGDIDFKSWKYDKVTAKRQPGSTFKLFVYTEAMNQGLTPCDAFLDGYIEVPATGPDGKPTVWRPHNANGEFSEEMIPLKSAFAQSLNSIAVRVGMNVGVDNIAKTAKAMGMKSKLDPIPALCLGASDVTLLEMVDSYCTIADDGYQKDPVLVERIEDRYGNVIYRSESPRTRAVPYRSAFLMQQMLRGGLTEPGGTSMSLWRFVGATPDCEWGGKTGTSNNHSDAWFIGVSPKLVVGAWVGGEYRCIHFRTGELGQGSRTALPICGYFIQSVLADKNFSQYHAKFDKTPKESIGSANYNCAGVYIDDNDSIDFETDSLSASDVTLTDGAPIVDEPSPETLEPANE